MAVLIIFLISLLVKFDCSWETVEAEAAPDNIFDNAKRWDQNSKLTKLIFLQKLLRAMICHCMNIPATWACRARNAVSLYVVVAPVCPSCGPAAMKNRTDTTKNEVIVILACYYKIIIHFSNVMKIEAISLLQKSIEKCRIWQKRIKPLTGKQTKSFDMKIKINYNRSSF